MFQTPEEQAEFIQAEYDLLSPVFKDNKVLLKVVRKVILGIELLPTEKDLIKQVPQTVVDRIASFLLPKVTGEEEMHSVNDFWFQFNLKERTEYQVKIDIEYLPLVQEFFTDSIARLNGQEGKIKISDIEYSKSVSKEQNIVNVIARNIILATTEGLLSTIYSKANTKPLTAEDLKKAQKQNSTR
jgi:hypothetical protein